MDFASFFDSEPNFQKLLTELERWRGTPFLHGLAKPKVGADCVRFVERVLVNIGAIKPVTFPPYVTRGGGARMLQIFCGIMDGIPEFQRLGPPLPKPYRGDVLLISSGKALHHLAIVAKPPVVWHCLREVSEANLHDKIVWQNLYRMYRVKPIE